MPLGAEGEFALVVEQLQSALERPGQPVKRGSMAHEHDVCALLVEAACRLGSSAVLLQHLPHLEELARRDNHRMYLPLALRARGVAHRLAGEYAEAQVPLQKALEGFTGMEMRWQMGRTLTELGVLEQERGNPEGALTYFARAVEAFDALGAAPDEARTQALIAALER